jgi:hypothetical protein
MTAPGAAGTVTGDNPELQKAWPIPFWSGHFFESRVARSLPEKFFNKPVRVDLGPGARAKVVGSTRTAAECLLHSWPKDWGQQHRAAREACIAVLKGEEQPEFARLAFIEAASEAGILVSS